jgi:hypothetical protein
MRRAASPNPQWCSTEGGEKFTGGGLTCVPGSAAKDQLRFRVRALYADGLPAALSSFFVEGHLVWPTFNG